MDLCLKLIDKHLEITGNWINRLMLNFLKKKNELRSLSKNVGSIFDKLKQIILIEKFKKCIHPEIRTYIDEQKT